MARPRILPDNTTLRSWVESGLTQEQIIARVYEETGHRVSRSAVAVALHRAGLTDPAPRYPEEVPWKVRTVHLNQYPVRMLRAWGRVRAGNALTETEAKRFGKWREWVEAEEVAVAYDPENGFFYVRSPRSDWPSGIPIKPGITPMPPEP